MSVFCNQKGEFYVIDESPDGDTFQRPAMILSPQLYVEHKRLRDEYTDLSSAYGDLRFAFGLLLLAAAAAFIGEEILSLSFEAMYAAVMLPFLIALISNSVISFRRDSKRRKCYENFCNQNGMEGAVTKMAYAVFSSDDPTVAHLVPGL